MDFVPPQYVNALPGVFCFLSHLSAESSQATKSAAELVESVSAILEVGGEVENQKESKNHFGRS